MVTQRDISIDLAQVRMHRERPDSWPIRSAPSLVAAARSCCCRVRRPHRSQQPEFLAGLGPRSWRTSTSATPDRWLPVARRVLPRAGL